MDEQSRHRRKVFLAFLLFLVPALFFLGWSQASLNLSFLSPRSPGQAILLLALSTFIFLAFVIFALILLRILLKLYVERREQQMGSRFKTKMVVAFLGLSLVPVCFLFAFAYGLLNRSIDRWFGFPSDLVREDAAALAQGLQSQAEQRALNISARLARDGDLSRAMTRADRSAITSRMSEMALDTDSEAAVCLDTQARVLARVGGAWFKPSEFPGLLQRAAQHEELSGHAGSGGYEIFAVAQPVVDARGEMLGAVAGAMRLPRKLLATSDEIRGEIQKYDALSREGKAAKRMYMSMLWLLTLLILFIATWFALFLSKQVSVPIQALAQATEEVAKGNLAFRVSARADDELGILIKSFNQMTRQLQENRQAIEQAAKELQQANRQMEERGHTIEAILESIPTAVISFDPEGRITRVNSTAQRLFGRADVQAPRSLTDLFSAEDAREVARLFRRAARQGGVTRQLELDWGGRRAYVALTISPVRARHGAVGSVLVLEDLTESLRAQRATAWQEVAQRIAHEIKNPLTPIQLSAERLQRLIERAGPTASTQELLPAVSESVSLISREVSTLKSLVDEFSAFARFPASRLVSSSLNTIVEQALNVFEGRLNGIVIHRDLAADLPSIAADPEQIKRAVVNLIDNAAEALEHSLRKEIWVRTALEPDRDLVEMVVADSGPGIPLEAKEKLFLPYFSTKRRGTGLGLAIVSRIVAEHGGSIRVEENRPTGTKFVIELPLERAPAEPAASQIV